MEKPEWKRPLARLILGLVLSFVSGFASVAFSYTSIQISIRTMETRQDDRRKLESELNGLEVEARSIRQKLAQLPEDWVTASLRYSTRLAEITRTMDSLESRLGKSGESGSEGPGASSLRDLSQLFSLDFRVLLLVFFGVLSVVLEVATFGMLHGRKGPLTRGRASKLALVLENAFQAEDKPLRGRRVVAANLGLAEPDVREIFERINALGITEKRTGKKGFFLRVPLDEAFETLGRSG